MTFKGNSLFDSKKITKELINMLKEENRFESITMEMPDMIMCKIRGSEFFPKSRQFQNTPIIQCSFIIDENKIIFEVGFFPAKNCENIVKRLNNELPCLRKRIDINSKEVSIPIMITIADKADMQRIKNEKNEGIKRMMLKSWLYYFFVKEGNAIIHKILEIMLNVVV